MKIRAWTVLGILRVSGFFCFSRQIFDNGHLDEPRRPILELSGGLGSGHQKNGV